MHIRVAPFDLWFTYICMGCMCAIGALFIIVSAFEIIPFDASEDRTSILAFSIIWTVAVSWLAYVFFKIPTQIYVSNFGNITLRSLVQTTYLEPNQVIKLSCDSDGDWTLHHTKGRLDLRYFRSDDLKQFLSWVVLANPGIHVPEELGIRGAE